MHLGAAHLLERDLLADDHLGHARRAEVHAGVALDHHHDVAERRDVRAARRRRPEEQADLRHLPGELHLVVEDAPRAAAAGEHLDLIGDARAGRVDQVEERAARASRAVSWMRRIFSTVRLPHEPAFTVESLAMMATVRPSIVADAGDDAVGGQLGVEGVGERGVLDERARVDEPRDALAREELALLGVLLVVLGGAALLDLGGLPPDFTVARHSPSTNSTGAFTPLVRCEWLYWVNIMPSSRRVPLASGPLNPNSMAEIAVRSTSPLLTNVEMGMVTTFQSAEPA